MSLLSKIILLLSVLLTGCGIPKDPAGTFNKVKSQQLKVGIVNNHPFTVKGDEKYSGIEVEIIKDFADENNLKIAFIEDSESNLIKQLERREINILIGGFDKKTVWKEKAGFTTSYDDKHIILIPKGENRLVFELESIINKR